MTERSSSEMSREVSNEEEGKAIGIKGAKQKRGVQEENSLEERTMIDYLAEFYDVAFFFDVRRTRAPCVLTGLTDEHTVHNECYGYPCVVHTYRRVWLHSRM